MAYFDEIKMLIIEDEISESTDLLMKLDALNVKDVHCVTNFNDSISEIKRKDYDLVFVDVFLSGQERGTQIAELLANRDVPFVITTKHADLSYFDNIKRFKPIAYFQKPVDPLALRYRVESLFKEMNDKKPDFIFHRTGTSYKRFEMSSINYVEGEGNYVSVFTNDEKILLRQSLKSFLSKLDSSVFMQIHRKWVVKLSKVESYDSEDNIVSIGDMSLPVGRTFQSKLIKRLRS